ncbi:hypothetical protein PVAND_006650 [Polypedilum vanderplanki]|uniref:RNA helicase n=1 Tax=Polypedilum vanderplanki TaxID=319348 RepID=A0A9J6C4V0_POLVA|nr:hypothetical protein PVAND_006650 [Polypedilum vanderplanki]
MMEKAFTLDEQRRKLPVFQYRQHIINCIQQHATLILLAETGSGKSTQICQYIYESNLLKNGMIAITQPRRVAAVTLAQRVTREKNRHLGELVSYAIRFEDTTTGTTKIKFMTEGILLREAINDKYLKKYDFIILDEAHERTINTDVLFGLVKTVQRDRKFVNLPELKIIIMSATMDVDHFSKYFNNCNVLYLPGRTHNVTVKHTKIKQDDYMFAALATLFDIHLKAPPQEDVLIFLTGKDEIESMAQQIRTIVKSPDLEGKIPLKVFPLHASLPQKKQMDAFVRSSENQRRVVIATNIAETSLTLPGIKYVIDTGVVKFKSYDPKTGLESLKIHKISQAQAWQRSGRAGRESDGVCYRTYTKAEMDSWEKMTIPEILRCNLASTMLNLLAINLNVEKFDFIDKPPKNAIMNALECLKQLDAIKIQPSQTTPQLTQIGKLMSAFPILPMYSKCIISAEKFKCTSEILDIIALLSSENIYLEPSANNRDVAATQHAKFHTLYGDHLTMLKIFAQFKKSDKNKWCQDHFFSFKNLSYALEVRKQLEEICQNNKIPINKSEPVHPDQILKCLITGLFNNIAEYNQRDNNYIVLVNRQRAQIHPSSTLSGYNANFNGISSNGSGNGIIAVGGKMKSDHNQKPAFILFTDIVSTTNIYLRTVSRINPEWINEVISSDSDFVNRINANHF